MALFYECMQSCAHIVLDTADIVRDGDFTSTIDDITGLPNVLNLPRFYVEVGDPRIKPGEWAALYSGNPTRCTSC